MPYKPLSQHQMLMLQIMPAHERESLYQKMMMTNYVPDDQWGSYIDSTLPAQFQLGNYSGDQAYQEGRNRYLQENRPKASKMRTDEQRFGGEGNSFATQRTEQYKAAMNREASNAGEDRRYQDLQHRLAGRAAYIQSHNINMGNTQMPVNPFAQQPVAKLGGPPGTSSYGGLIAGGLNVARGVDNMLGNPLAQIGNSLGNAGGPFARKGG